MLKSERAFRVVLRGLHSSEDTSCIAEDLMRLGHSVRQIVNVRHRTTKEALPLFYIDLEPNHNNKEIYKIKTINYTKVSFEAPYKKKEVLQCKRCQRFGHSKNQCNRPFRWRKTLPAIEAVPLINNTKTKYLNFILQTKERDQTWTTTQMQIHYQRWDRTLPRKPLEH